MTVSRFLLVAALCATLAGPAASSPKTTSLEYGFRTCLELPRVTLAGDLMRSIWDSNVRSSFMPTHQSVLRPNSLMLTPLEAEGTGSLTTAKVLFKQPVRVAGVRALALTATTCADGCGWANWTLEFGTLNRKDRARLASWVRSAPSTEDEASGIIKVQLVTDENLQTSLVCDISN